jgi:hypothetical protein
LLSVLFPRLQGVLGNMGYGSDWDAKWAREQRVCSPYYFDRYFSYAVPLGDIPDQRLKQVIDLAEAGDPGLAELLSAFNMPAAAARLVEKLQMQTPALRSRGAHTLARAIAKKGAMFPMDERVFWIGSTFAQAALLVGKLVMRSGAQDERTRLGQQIIREAQPLPFAAECFRWLREDKDLPEAEWVVAKASVKKLGESLASRIREAASSRPPYEEFGDRGPHLLYMWRTYGPEADLETYLRARFDQSPAEAVKLLESYVPAIQEMETGFRRRGAFRRDQYDAVAAAVDPEIVITALKSVYGDTVGSYELSREISADERLAHQFAALHLAVSAEKRLRPGEGGAEGPPAPKEGTDQPSAIARPMPKKRGGREKRPPR